MIRGWGVGRLAAVAPHPKIDDLDLRKNIAPDWGLVLWKSLTPEQRDQLVKTGWFEVRPKALPREFELSFIQVYRGMSKILFGEDEVVFKIDINGNTDPPVCIWPTYIQQDAKYGTIYTRQGFTGPYKALSIKLLLESDPLEFFRIANVDGRVAYQGDSVLRRQLVQWTWRP